MVGADIDKLLRKSWCYTSDKVHFSCKLQEHEHSPFSLLERKANWYEDKGKKVQRKKSKMKNGCMEDGQ